jgi:hypothetical protein
MVALFRRTIEARSLLYYMPSLQRSLGILFAPDIPGLSPLKYGE